MRKFLNDVFTKRIYNIIVVSLLISIGSYCTTTNVNAGRHFHGPVYTDGRTDPAYFSETDSPDENSDRCRCRTPAPTAGKSGDALNSKDRGAFSAAVPVSDKAKQNDRGYFSTEAEPDSSKSPNLKNQSSQPVSSVKDRGALSNDDPEGFFSNPPKKGSVGRSENPYSDPSSLSNPNGPGRTPLIIPGQQSGSSGINSPSAVSNQSSQPPVIPVAAGMSAAASGWNDNPAPEEFNETGTASWYGRDFDGKRTASGDSFDSRRPTAAHKSIPLGSIISVKNLDNNKEMLVLVNDRGPYVSGRILDLSEYAAEILDYKSHGLARVGIKIIKKADGKSARPDNSPGVTADYFGPEGRKASASSSVPASSEALTYNTPAVDPKKTGTESKENMQPPLKLAQESVEKESALSGYSVQVGIFETKENALQMRRFLSSYGVPVGVFQRGNMFVVKVGDYNSRYAAEQMKYRLVADGYGGFITEPK